MSFMNASTEDRFVGLENSQKLQINSIWCAGPSLFGRHKPSLKCVLLAILTATQCGKLT